MNKKSVGSNPPNPSPTRRSLPRRPLGFRSLETRPAPGSPGSRRKRRVRFEGILDEEAPKASSSFPYRATRSHGEDGGGGPKTSEFAFFKRLKEGGGRAGSGSASRAVVDGSIFSRPGRSTCTAASDEVDRPFFVTQSATPQIPVPSHSKLHVAIDKSAVDRTKADAIIGEIFSDWEQKVLQSDSPKSQGIHKKHEDIFSEKRNKLCRWIAENSSPEVANLCSKGCDFVSELLKRLFPENSKDEALALLNKERQETDANYESVTNPGSDIQLRNHHGMPINYNSQNEYGQHSDVDSLSILSYGNDLVTHGGAFGINTEAALQNEPTPDIPFVDNYWVPPMNNLRLEGGPFSDIGLLPSFSRGCHFLNKLIPVSSTLVDSTFGFCSDELRVGSSSSQEFMGR